MCVKAIKESYFCHFYRMYRFWKNSVATARGRRNALRCKHNTELSGEIKVLWYLLEKSCESARRRGRMGPTVDFQNSWGANIWATLVCIHSSSLYGNWSHLTFFASPQSVSLFCSDDTMWPWWHLGGNEDPCLSHSKQNMGDFHIMTFLPIKLHLSLLHSSCQKQTHQFLKVSER